MKSWLRVATRTALITAYAPSSLVTSSISRRRRPPRRTRNHPSPRLPYRRGALCTPCRPQSPPRPRPHLNTPTVSVGRGGLLMNARSEWAYLLPPLPLRSTRPLPHQRQNLLDLRCVATGSEPTTRVVAVRVVAGHTYPGQAAPPARLIAFGAWLRAAASGPVRVGRAAAMRQRAANASTALTVAREQLCRERLAFAAGRSADVVGQPRPGQRVAALLVLVGVPREICAQRASSLSAKAGPASPRLRGRRRHGWRAGCFCGPHLRAQTGSAAARRTVSCGGSAESRDSA